MKDDLVRFGVAMESNLVDQLDALAAARSCNRSELLRDLTRAEISRTSLDDRVPAFAAVTLVYNHHVRELAERLMALQHDLGDQVRSSMHVHLDHAHCLEVIVMRARSDQLRSVAGRLIGAKGVIQGAAEYFAEGAIPLRTVGRSAPRQRHGHAHVPKRRRAKPPKAESAVKRAKAVR